MKVHTIGSLKSQSREGRENGRKKLGEVKRERYMNGEMRESWPLGGERDGEQGGDREREV